MANIQHYVVEMIVESHEKNREDLSNEEVMCLPVVDGPYETFQEAADATGLKEQYEVVSLPE